MNICLPRGINIYELRIYLQIDIIYLSNEKFIIGSYRFIQQRKVSKLGKSVFQVDRK